MSKEMNNTRTPRLRFAEFREAGEWEETALHKLGETLNGLSGKSASDFGSGKPYVTYKQVFDRAWVDFERCEKVNIVDGENQNELNQGDILFTTSSETPNEVGYASVILQAPPKPLFLNSFCFAFRPFSLKKLNPEFSQYLFRSPTYRKLIGVLAQGSTRFNISKGGFLNLKLPIPKEEKEQQKIAACLSSLDELISAQSEKIKALQRHKKGLMQQFFPAEGETAPRVRFGEFEGEWNKKTLFDLAINGFSNGVFNDPKKVGVGYKLINVLDMYSEAPISEDKLSLVGISESEFLKNKVEFGDIFFTRSSLVAAGIAHSNIYLGTSNYITFDGHLIRLRPNTSIIEPKFLHYLLKTNSVRSQLVAKGKTATMTTIGQADIASVHLRLPKPNEQQKIAACLSSLDELMAAEGRKLELLKEQKRGLMQGLFPNDKEMDDAATE